MINHQIIENNGISDSLNKKYCEFIKTVFPSADFSEWIKQGLWPDKYFSVCITNEDKIISNVSIAFMDIILNSKLIRGIQFGGVGTLPEYRNQGYSKLLMEFVLNKYKNSTDLFFLFANDSVLDFYPRFGFKRKAEVLFKHDLKSGFNKFRLVKLEMTKKTDFELLKSKLKSRLPVTKIFGADNYDYVTWWYILNFYRDKIYYLEKEDAIFILDQEENKLHVLDIIFSKSLNINSVISKIIPDENISSILYYFSPDVLDFHYDSVVSYEEGPLFVRGDFNIEENYSKFPFTAQT